MKPAARSLLRDSGKGKTIKMQEFVKVFGFGSEQTKLRSAGKVENVKLGISQGKELVVGSGVSAYILK